MGRLHRATAGANVKRPDRALLHLIAFLLLGVAGAAKAAAPVYDNAFWQHWSDGRAEIAAYTLQRPRYGEMRTGTSVLIFVTEPWSMRNHVKADDGKHPKDDVIQVLKLNTVEDFQTGIYDYNLMTSSWTALQPAPGRPAGAATKVSFSSQEWCGTSWHDVTFDARAAADVVRSYFDGETSMRMIESPAAEGKAALVEDNVLVWARGLAAPVVARGANATVAFLPSLTRSRLDHKPVEWTSATLARDATTMKVTVPAGTFDVERARVTVGARSIEVFVEVAAPRRIVKVTQSDGTVMELKGSVRTSYWKQNHQGDEALLQQLGL
jgi:hypothetical protein